MPASRTLLLALAVVAPALVVPGRASTAQRPQRETRWLYAAELGVLHTNHPYESGMGSYGASMGVERGWSDRVAARAVVAWAETFGRGDDVSICRPLPNDGCYPPAYFPLRVWSLEFHGVVTPDRDLPVKLVAGGGLALPVGVRRNTRVTDHLEHDRTLKGIARAGASLGLGRSERAQRLQYTRGWLSGPYESFDRIDQVSFVVVF